MNWTRRQLLYASGMSVGLSGCLGNITEPGDDEEMPDPTVRVSSTDEYGDILVDADGMALYMFDQDTQGEPMSACYDGCAEAWPPLIVEGDVTAGEDVSAELTTFEREDGSLQVAANGWPLYYFDSDEEPGDVNGQGVNDVWWVLRPDGTRITPDMGSEGTVQVRSHDEYGDILVDTDGMTLYMFDQDTQGEGMSACYDDCADAWPPLTSDSSPTAGDGVMTELSSFERDDGSTHVAANGWPLYYFQSDEEPGDATGQGVNDVWWVLDSNGAPKRPDSNSSSGGYY